MNLNLDTKRVEQQRYMERYTCSLDHLNRVFTYKKLEETKKPSKVEEKKKETNHKAQDKKQVDNNTKN